MRTILLGLDAFDPGIFENLSAQGRLPNLGQFVARNQYARLTVSNPPQSEVSWTSIASGADPGVHGMFDFVHRDPATYKLFPSLLRTQTGLLGTQFVPAHTTQTLFEQATREGYPASVLWWPATFPARLEVPVQTIPGLGTPDVLGRLGVGAVYSPDPSLANPRLKTAVEMLHKRGAGRYTGVLKGPAQKTRQGSKETTLEFQLELDGNRPARFTFGKTLLSLTPGQWSPIFTLTFPVGFMVNVQAITRVTLTQVEPEPRLYFLPLQIHPLHSPWRYATPPGFVRETWKRFGPFLTLGWPQDTTGLEEGWISDDQFIELCRSIDATREQIFFYYLDKFKDGVLANVFDTLDRVQHMYLRTRPEVVEAWYLRLDELVGKVQTTLARRTQDKPRLLILSDHGFAPFDYKVHLNRWLVENGYLVPGQAGQENSFQNVDWLQSQAYALGLNSLYLNIQYREGQGRVTPDEIEALRDRLRQDLMAWRGPDGRPVVQQVYYREDVFHGPLLASAPDMVVGYSPGYRASAETGLGKWEADSLAPNTDHWGSDHCIDPQSVPGVLFANTSLANFPQPSFRDIPVLATGKTLDHAGAPPPLPSKGEAEDQKALEERLKGLVYF